MKTNNVDTLRLFWLLLILMATCIAGLALNHYGPASFDKPILLWFRVTANTDRLAGPQWISHFWLAVSWTGDKIPRITIAIATITGLLLMRRWHSAFFISGVLLSGIALTILLKHWIARPRPHLVSHLDYISLASFPSGHTLNSTLFYLTVTWIFSPLLLTRVSRYLLYASAITLSLATGISRIALGVHWPSDVLASWVIAVTWLGLGIILVRYYWPKNQCQVITKTLANV